MNSQRTPQHRYKKEIKFPDWFNLDDYKICDEISDLEWWAYNIKIRRYLHFILESFKEGLDEELRNLSTKRFWDNFLKEREIMLHLDGVVNLLKNKNCLSNELNYTWWKEKNQGLQQLDYRDTININRYFTDKFENDRKKATEQKTSYNERDEFTQTYSPACIVIDLSLSKEHLQTEFNNYIDKHQKKFMEMQKIYPQEFLNYPPHDFKNIKGESIVKKIAKAKVLQCFDMRMIAKMSNFKISDEELSKKLDIEIEKIRTDTNRIIKRYITHNDPIHFNSLMYQAKI